MAVIALIMTLGTVTAQEYMFVWKTDGTSDTYRVSDLDSIGFYMPGNIPDNTGGIGSFSVSATQKVTFSHGNLQYQASTGTWRFAVKQWDIVGMGYGETNSYNYCDIGGTVENSDNRQIGSNYNGWIDLFGWGTSGWNSGAAAYQPYSTSTYYTDYYPGDSYLNNLTGEYAYADWGVYNQIGNDAPGTWRTLTTEEWLYLFDARANASDKYGAAKVNGITGVVVLPDVWTLPAGCDFTPGMGSMVDLYDWGKVATTNIYNDKQWQDMELNGAVFLPAAGNRYDNRMFSVGTYGHYWSSTRFDTSFACSVYFYFGYLGPQDGNDRSGGRSVRLVRDIPN